MFMGMIRHSQGVLILSADISRGGERLGWEGRREGRELGVERRGQCGQGLKVVEALRVLLRRGII